MPNHVETKLWLIKPTQQVLSENEISTFWEQFISISPPSELPDREPRYFNFAKIIPEPDNLWLGNEGGDYRTNFLEIKEHGGLEHVLSVLRVDGYFKSGDNYWTPTLTSEQITKYGLISALDWRRHNWGTKWGAYSCSFDFESFYGNETAQVTFLTAWNVPEVIIRLIREKALQQGFDIIAEFGGELDYPGYYKNGEFSYFEIKWSEEKNCYIPGEKLFKTHK